MRVHAHIPVGEIAASLPHAAKLFDDLGIDYVLHGDLSLREACAEAGLDPAVVRQSIESLPHEKSVDRAGWSDAATQEVINELRDRRHPKLRLMLGHLATRLAEADRHEEMRGVREAFTDLCDVLQPHMTREEHMLFAVIQHLEDCWTHSERLSMNFVGGLDAPLTSTVLEHVQIMKRLDRLHDAVHALEADGEPRSRFIEAFDEFAHELKEHVHLENNVLYPRAVAMEAAVGKSRVSL